MKMTEAIRSMYGRPSDEQAFHQGTPVPGWHVEDEEGKMLPSDEFSEEDLLDIYENEFRDQAEPCSGTTPVEPAYTKIGGRWHEISGVDMDGRAVSMELHGPDALHLEAASQIEAISAILLVMKEGELGSRRPRQYVMKRFSDSLEMLAIIAGEMKK